MLTRKMSNNVSVIDSEDVDDYEWVVNFQKVHVTREIHIMCCLQLFNKI